MGCFVSTSEDDLKKEVPTLTPNQRDKCMIKLKMQRDKISRRIKDFEKQIDLNHAKAKQLAREKKKDQAIYYLAKKKMMMGNHKKFSNNILLIENRINQMENIMDDLEFTKMMNESNNEMRQLMEEVDMSALEEAQQISQEVDFQNEQVMDIINQNNQDDDIMKEFMMLGTEEKPEDVIDNTTKDEELNQNKPKIQTVQKEEQQMILA